MSADDSFAQEELDFTQPLEAREQRRAFLITYSQADLEKVPNCLRFSEIVLKAFEEAGGNRQVVQWSCCMEDHVDGGKHYHLAILFSGSRRWSSIKNAVYKAHNIALHFSSQHIGYVAAYRYVMKKKSVEEVLHSPLHPDLQTIKRSKTKDAMKGNASQAKKRKSENAQNPEKNKALRLSNTEVSDFILKNNLKSKNELMSAAQNRAESGERDLQSFILNKNPKAIADLIATTWQLHNAPKVLERNNTPRLSIVRSHAAGVCGNSCNGSWLVCARELLQKNGINLYVFANALREGLVKGRQKHINVILVGPTNCGKSFLLNPLEIIYKSFVNPATGRYAWVGLDECEVAYLNDFRWSSEIITWSDFLLLLEGQTVHLPRPKNQFATDLEISRENTIPIFATSKSPIEFVGKYNVRDDKETDMMSSRWNRFVFTYQIPQEKVKHLEPCPTCFSKLVLFGSDTEGEAT